MQLLSSFVAALLVVLLLLFSAATSLVLAESIDCAISPGGEVTVTDVSGFASTDIVVTNAGGCRFTIRDVTVKSVTFSDSSFDASTNVTVSNVRFTTINGIKFSGDISAADTIAISGCTAKSNTLRSALVSFGGNVRNVKELRIEDNTLSFYNSEAVAVLLPTEPPSNFIFIEVRGDFTSNSRFIVQYNRMEITRWAAGSSNVMTRAMLVWFRAPVGTRVPMLIAVVDNTFVVEMNQGGAVWAHAGRTHPNIKFLTFTSNAPVQDLGDPAGALDFWVTGNNLVFSMSRATMSPPFTFDRGTSVNFFAMNHDSAVAGVRNVVIAGNDVWVNTIRMASAADQPLRIALFSASFDYSAQSVVIANNTLNVGELVGGAGPRFISFLSFEGLVNISSSSGGGFLVQNNTFAVNSQRLDNNQKVQTRFISSTSSITRVNNWAVMDNRVDLKVRCDGPGEAHFFAVDGDAHTDESSSSSSSSSPASNFIFRSNTFIGNNLRSWERVTRSLFVGLLGGASQPITVLLQSNNVDIQTRAQTIVGSETSTDVDTDPVSIGFFLSGADITFAGGYFVCSDNDVNILVNLPDAPIFPSSGGATPIYSVGIIVFWRSLVASNAVIVANNSMNFSLPESKCVQRLLRTDALLFNGALLAAIAGVAFQNNTVVGELGGGVFSGMSAVAMRDLDGGIRTFSLLVRDNTFLWRDLTTFDLSIAKFSVLHLQMKAFQTSSLSQLLFINNLFDAEFRHRSFTTSNVALVYAPQRITLPSAPFPDGSAAFLVTNSTLNVAFFDGSHGAKCQLLYLQNDVQEAALLEVSNSTLRVHGQDAAFASGAVYIEYQLAMISAARVKQVVVKHLLLDIRPPASGDLAAVAATKVKSLFIYAMSVYAGASRVDSIRAEDLTVRIGTAAILPSNCDFMVGGLFTRLAVQDAGMLDLHSVVVEVTASPFSVAGAAFFDLVHFYNPWATTSSGAITIRDSSIQIFAHCDPDSAEQNCFVGGSALRFACPYHSPRFPESSSLIDVPSITLDNVTIFMPQASPALYRRKNAGVDDIPVITNMTVSALVVDDPFIAYFDRDLFSPGASPYLAEFRSFRQIAGGPFPFGEGNAAVEAAAQVRPLPKFGTITITRVRFESRFLHEDEDAPLRPIKSYSGMVNIDFLLLLGYVSLRFPCEITGSITIDGGTPLAEQRKPDGPASLLPNFVAEASPGEFVRFALVHLPRSNWTRVPQLTIRNIYWGDRRASRDNNDFRETVYFRQYFLVLLGGDGGESEFDRQRYFPTISNTSNAMRSSFQLTIQSVEFVASFDDSSNLDDNEFEDDRQQRVEIALLRSGGGFVDDNAGGTNSLVRVTVSISDSDIGLSDRRTSNKVGRTGLAARILFVDVLGAGTSFVNSGASNPNSDATFTLTNSDYDITTQNSTSLLVGGIRICGEATTKTTVTVREHDWLGIRSVKVWNQVADASDKAERDAVLDRAREMQQQWTSHLDTAQFDGGGGGGGFVPFLTSNLHPFLLFDFSIATIARPFRSTLLVSGSDSTLSLTADFNSPNDEDDSVAFPDSTLVISMLEVIGPQVAGTSVTVEAVELDLDGAMYCFAHVDVAVYRETESTQQVEEFLTYVMLDAIPPSSPLSVAYFLSDVMQQMHTNRLRVADNVLEFNTNIDCDTDYTYMKMNVSLLRFGAGSAPAFLTLRAGQAFDIVGNVVSTPNQCFNHGAHVALVAFVVSATPANYRDTSAAIRYAAAMSSNNNVPASPLRHYTMTGSNTLKLGQYTETEYRSQAAIFFVDREALLASAWGIGATTLEVEEPSAMMVPCCVIGLIGPFALGNGPSIELIGNNKIPPQPNDDDSFPLASSLFAPLAVGRNGANELSYGEYSPEQLRSVGIRTGSSFILNCFSLSPPELTPRLAKELRRAGGGAFVRYKCNETASRSKSASIGTVSDSSSFAVTGSTAEASESVELTNWTRSLSRRTPTATRSRSRSKTPVPTPTAGTRSATESGEVSVSENTSSSTESRTRSRTRSASLTSVPPCSGFLALEAVTTTSAAATTMDVSQLIRTGRATLRLSLRQRDPNDYTKMTTAGNSENPWNGFKSGLGVRLGDFVIFSPRNDTSSNIAVAGSNISVVSYTRVSSTVFQIQVGVSASAAAEHLSPNQELRVRFSISARALRCRFVGGGSNSSSRNYAVSSNIFTFSRSASGVDAGFVAGVKAASTAAAIVSAAMGAPGAMLALQRSNAIMSSLACQTRSAGSGAAEFEDEPYPLITSVTQMQLSSSPRLPFSAGTMVGNCLVLLAVIILSLVAVVFFSVSSDDDKKKKKKTKNNNNKPTPIFSPRNQAKAFFPGVIFPATVLLVEGFLTGATFLFAIGDSTERVIALIGCFVTAAVFAAFGFVLLRPAYFFSLARYVQRSDRIESDARKIDTVGHKLAQSFKTFFLPRGRWLDVQNTSSSNNSSKKKKKKNRDKVQQHVEVVRASLKSILSDDDDEKEQTRNPNTSFEGGFLTSASSSASTATTPPLFFTTACFSERFGASFDGRIRNFFFADYAEGLCTAAISLFVAVAKIAAADVCFKLTIATSFTIALVFALSMQMSFTVSAENFLNIAINAVLLSISIVSTIATYLGEDDSRSAGLVESAEYLNVALLAVVAIFVGFKVVSVSAEWLMTNGSKRFQIGRAARYGVAWLRRPLDRRRGKRKAEKVELDGVLNHGTAAVVDIDVEMI